MAADPSAPRALRVVLVRPRNPLNIGACARAMVNFGQSELVVLDPFEPVWRETRSAPDAEAIVQRATLAASWEEAVGEAIVIGTSSFHQRDLEHAVVELPGLPAYLAALPADRPVALVFGSERSGLSNEELARCQAVVRIPTQPGAPSMNLGQAVAVVLYELCRGLAPAGAGVAEPVEDLEPLIDSMAALGRAVDYPAGYDPAARWGRIRQALHGVRLPPAALRFLLSFFRRLRHKSEAGIRR